MRLAAAGIPTPALLHGCFITHLHSDHVTDFNDVLTTRWVTSPMPNPLSVVGPPGVDRLVARTLIMLEDDIAYRVAHHEDLHGHPDAEVTEVLEGAVRLAALDAAGVVVTAAPTDHRPVAPTVGYRVEAEGASIVIAGDTVPCDGLRSLLVDADVYVQTVIREDLVRSVPMQRFQDICDYHSTVEQAARLAEEAGVKHLVLTHPVPAPQPGTEPEWIALASAHFGGTVTLAEDLTAIDC